MSTAMTVEPHIITPAWHVGRSWPGMFPLYEFNCPCPKAPCGLVAPVAEIPCEQHLGNYTLRQAHLADVCATRKRPRWHRPVLR